MSGSIRSGSVVALKDLPAAALAVYTRPIIYIESGASVDQALHMMKQNNILSLPVFDPVGSQFIGILHMEDLLNYIAFFNFKDGKLSDTFENGKKPVSDIIGLAPEGKKIWITDVTDSVNDVMEAMTKGVHRMLVRLPLREPPENIRPGFPETFSEIRLVAQKDVVRFLAERLEGKSLHCLRLNVDRPINELNLTWSKVLTMRDNESAIEGFQKMAREHMSALGIVDEKGELVANLSASDLRGLTSNLIHRLMMNVLDFLKESHRGNVPPVISVTDRYTVREIMTKMLAFNVHRIWIIDGYNMKPIGVMTLTDIISLFYRNELIPAKLPHVLPDYVKLPNKTEQSVEHTPSKIVA